MASIAFISSISFSDFSLSEPSSFFSSFCSLVSASCSPRISISSSLRKDAQPHVEDGFGLVLGEAERLHQLGLGLVLGADDLDDLVEVQKTAR